MSEWISVKDKDSPPMETVILCAKGKVMVGWNESVQPEEDAVYVSWEEFPETSVDEKIVTHWAPLPEPPEMKDE